MPSLISQMRNGQQTNQPQINEAYLNQLKSIMHSANPQQGLTNLMAQNPQMAQMFQMLQGRGNLQQVFETMAKQRGIDPNLILNKLLK